MSELTAQERAAGRWFRDQCQLRLDELNRLDPPGSPAGPLYVLPLWRVVRHDCIARAGASAGIALKERRWASPELWACYCSEIGPLVPESFPHRDCDGGKALAAGGLFAFVFREGRCGAPAGCGLTARSRQGRVVLASDSPGRGGQAPAHPGNPRLARP